MKTNINDLLINFLLVAFLIFILVFSDNVINTVLYGIKIWKYNIFTSLFPFFVITDLLINYGFIDLLGEILKKVMNKLFNLPGEASFVIIASMFSGFPSSSKYIKSLLDTKKINIKNAEYLLSFTHFPNPLFIIGIVGKTILKNKTCGIVLYLSIIVGSFVIAMFLKDKNNKCITNSNIKETLEKIHIKNKSNNFIKILTESIIKTINTLLLLLGIIITFLVLTTVLSSILNLNIYYKTIISGLLEMTSGINNIKILSIPLVIKSSLITSFICFGGISIHLQIMSILCEYEIHYNKYFLCRILHAVISTCINIILTTLFIT